MATTRIKDLSKTATTVNSDANLVLDGNTGGTQKISRDNFRQDTADAFVAAPGTYNLAPLNSGTGKIDAVYLSSSSDTPKGAWDASTNTPTLADGSGTAGDYYDVTVAGSSDLGSGSIAFTVGDVVKYNGTVWFKIDSVANILDGVSTIDGAKTAIEIPDVGTGPSQVPLNQHLGTMAYQSSDGVSVAKAEIESTTGTATTQALTVTDGSSTKFVVQEDGKVGVGNSAPSDMYVTGNQLVVGDGADHRGMTILSATNKTGNIYFADGTGAGSYIGQIQYNHTSNALNIATNGATRATIDSSGRVGIGTAIPPQKLTVQGGGVQIAGAISSPASGVSALLLDWVNSNSRYWSRGVDATTQGTHNFYVLESDGGNQVNALEVNASGIKFPASGLGIDFGSGATLSDYEEGTFTPTIYYANTSGLTISYTTQTGRYVRVGDLVSVHAYLIWTVTGTPANDNIGIGGLPHQPNAARQYLQCIDSQGQSAAAECSSVLAVATSVSSSFGGSLADEVGAGTHTMLVHGTYQTS